MGHWYGPSDGELKKKILEEAHKSPYSIRRKGDKLYKDLRFNFWWPCMKKKDR